MTYRSTDIVSSHRDWFVAAIESDGSVAHCLGAVLNELQHKVEFVKALQVTIGERVAGNPDAITDIGQRVKALENTLRFRLSILSPERKGAWFRPATAMGGPFSGPMLTEPVFCAYDETQHGRIRHAIAMCWEKRNLMDYPFRPTEPTLWKTLLAMNFELESLDRFNPLFPRLTDLPEQMPANLESRSLRAFLTNVRAELVAHRSRLGQCYLTLLEASERFWLHHASTASRRADKNTSQSAHDIRSGFKQRRTSQTLPRPVIKTASDLEALRFMGFAEYPGPDELKQRYHSLALEMHPDRPCGNEQRFKMLNRSYKHLVKVCR